MLPNLKPQRAIVPIVRSAPAKPISELLGTGFFVGNEKTIHLVTARHVITGAPLADGETFAVVIPDDVGIAVVRISQIRAFEDFDVAVCSVEQSLLKSTRPLPVATFDPFLNEDVFSYEYSSTRIEKTADGFNVSFEPYAHKGNVVRLYMSTFPEATRTASLLTSFPALQGASGAPVIVSNKQSKQFAVVGMLVANAERHLLPAQVVTIEDGPSYKESTSYFPVRKSFGRGVARSAAYPAQIQVVGRMHRDAVDR